MLDGTRRITSMKKVGEIVASQSYAERHNQVERDTIGHKDQRHVALEATLFGSSYSLWKHNMINTSSSVTRGNMENGEFKKQASLPPVDAIQEESESFSEKVVIAPETNKDDPMESKSPEQPHESSLKTSSEAAVTENDAESSLPPSNTVNGTGKKRKKETERPTSPTSPQAKQPRLSEKQVPDTANKVINNSSDAQTESDECSSSDDQKVGGGASPSAPDTDSSSAVASQQNASQEPLLERVARVERGRARAAPSPEALVARAEKPSKETKQSFPHLMYRLLEDDEYKDALCWLQGGLSFAIDPDVFLKKVIAVHFRGSKFDSFKRKLNRWGFRRVMETEAPGTMTYYHRLFRRGFPSLLTEMNGGRIMGKKETNLSMERKLEKLAGQQYSSAQYLGDPAIMAMLGQSLPTRASAGGGFPGMQMMGNQGSLQQLVSAEGLPMSLAPSAGGSMRVNDVNRMMLIEQERLRLELERKSQEERQLRQKLNEEIYYRRAQEEQMRELLLVGANPSRNAPTDFSLQQSLALQMAQGTTWGMDPYSTLPSNLLQGMMPSQFRQVNAPHESIAIRMPVDPSASSPMGTGSSPANSRNAQLGRFQSLEQNQQERDGDYTRQVNEEVARRQKFDENDSIDRRYGA